MMNEQQFQQHVRIFEYRVHTWGEFFGTNTVQTIEKEMNSIQVYGLIKNELGNSMKGGKVLFWSNNKFKKTVDLIKKAES